jgi:hypothetical protein
MNQSKTISANSKGITINFGDVNKHKFVYYDQSKFVNNKTNYQAVEEIGFNKVQQRLYAEAVYGLKAIPHEVLMEMRVERIRTIQAIHARAKEVINHYKQEVSNEIVDGYLSSVFPKSPIIKQMLNVRGTDSMIKCNLSLKDLKITPKMLSYRLIKHSILPENFFKLA